MNKLNEMAEKVSHLKISDKIKEGLLLATVKTVFAFSSQPLF